MAAPSRPAEGQDGQVLVLFSFMAATLVMAIMLVVDVGFYLHERQEVQSAADAAALAGSQELPDDPNAAEAVALQYITNNGLDENDVDISFRCTSDSANICLDGDGRYDTIVVTPTSQAPSFFGGILRVIGVNDSCWLDGCEAQATAAGCRGLCGPIGNAPVDVVFALDHSYSMSTTDLSNAKNAILELQEDFNANLQTVGLAVTPPVDPSDMCDSISYWTEPHVWLSAALTDTFQSAPGILDPNSPPVYYTNCVDRTSPYDLCCGGHTDVGSPIKAAADELIANGRPDVTHGIILVTDGAANAMPTTSTGRLDCSFESAVTSGSGDNNGYESSPWNACGNGGGYATDNNSGTSTSTNCSSSNKDRHNFYGFSADTATGGSSILGIEVQLDVWANGSGTRGVCVQLSWDGGFSWTGYDTANISGSENRYTFGGASDTWGRTWSASDLSNANFRVRVVDVADSTFREFFLDSVAVDITYAGGGGGSFLGPCDYASQMATQAKAAGIEIYAIAFGAGGDECDDEDPSSPWYNVDAVEFLESLATDEYHFFDEPKSSDLEPIFKAIGAQLTGGSRLVE